MEKMYSMTVPLRKKDRYIVKSTDGQVDEISMSAAGEEGQPVEESKEAIRLSKFD